MSPRQLHRGPYGRVADRIGSRLAEIRYEKRKTHADCAGVLKISERAYGALERSDFIPDNYIAPLAAFFGMDAQALAHELDCGPVEVAGSSKGAA